MHARAPPAGAGGAARMREPRQATGTTLPSKMRMVWPSNFVSWKKASSSLKPIDISWSSPTAIRSPRPLAVAWNRAYFSPMNGYSKACGGAKVSLMVRGEIQRIRLRMEPALSLVPDPRAPPKGCCPTTAPVGLSFT
jgi:hypothetical protein